MTTCVIVWHDIVGRQRRRAVEVAARQSTALAVCCRTHVTPRLGFRVESERLWRPRDSSTSANLLYVSLSLSRFRSRHSVARSASVRCGHDAQEKAILFFVCFGCREVALVSASRGVLSVFFGRHDVCGGGRSCIGEQASFARPYKLQVNDVTKEVEVRQDFRQSRDQ